MCNDHSNVLVEIPGAQPRGTRYQDHYHDDTRDDDGWWVCNSCGRRVRSSRDDEMERLQGVEQRLLDLVAKRRNEVSPVLAMPSGYHVDDVVAAKRTDALTDRLQAVLDGE